MNTIWQGRDRKRLGAVLAFDMSMLFALGVVTCIEECSGAPIWGYLSVLASAVLAIRLAVAVTRSIALDDIFSFLQTGVLCLSMAAVFWMRDVNATETVYVTSALGGALWGLLTFYCPFDLARNHGRATQLASALVIAVIVMSAFSGIAVPLRDVRGMVHGGHVPSVALWTMGLAWMFFVGNHVFNTRLVGLLYLFLLLGGLSFFTLAIGIPTVAEQSAERFLIETVIFYLGMLIPLRGILQHRTVGGDLSGCAKARNVDPDVLRWMVLIGLCSSAVWRWILHQVA